MASKKVIILAVFGLGLMFLFLGLFGSKSYFRAQEALDEKARLEKEIADISYQNAVLGSSSTPKEGVSTGVNGVISFYEPTGFEILGNVPTPYKVLVAFAFAAAILLIVASLLIFKKYNFERKEARLKAQKDEESEYLDEENDGEKSEEYYFSSEIVFDDKLVDISTKSGLNRVCDTIAVGGIAIIPCDTVYGICSLVNDMSKSRIDAIKERDPEKNYIILSSLQRAHNLLGRNLANELYSLWPGPITLISLLANGTEKVAVRVPDDPMLQRILATTGAMYSTSVNISGEPLLNDIRVIKARFANKVDIIGYDPTKKFTQPSTILDASVFPFKLVREGAITRQELEKRFQLQDEIVLPPMD